MNLQQGIGAEAWQKFELCCWNNSWEGLPMELLNVGQNLFDKNQFLSSRREGMSTPNEELEDTRADLEVAISRIAEVRHE